MSPVAVRLNWVWRLCMTGFCFVLFGVGGLLLSLVWFNLLLVTVRNRHTRRRIARHSISASFRFFLVHRVFPGKAALIFRKKYSESLNP